MIKLPFVLLFTAITAFFWGVYGILLRQGTESLGHSSLRAFVGVGIAYFLIAVLVPLGLLSRKPEKGFWSVSGTLLSLFAGTVGALGALGVILSLAFKGQAIYVMPIVFGGAPVVNTLVTSWLNKSFSQIKPMFIIGLVLVAIGAVGVLRNAPAKPAVANAKAAVVDGAKEADKDSIQSKAEAPNAIAIGASICLAVVCWGAYGPFLHIGQMKMGGSRLRPFCCVGIAYFIIAVAVPVMILMASPDKVTLNWDEVAKGMGWSILAGTAGAIGALGIIMAFNYGGKPIFVMPLIFGFAPVINTLTSMLVGGSLDKITGLFIGSLLLGIGGAVTVLVFAPKAKPHGAASEAKGSGSKPIGSTAIDPKVELPSTNPTAGL
jgi:MFS family permease